MEYKINYKLLTSTQEYDDLPYLKSYNKIVKCLDGSDKKHFMEYGGIETDDEYELMLLVMNILHRVFKYAHLIGVRKLLLKVIKHTCNKEDLNISLYVIKEMYPSFRKLIY